MTEAQADGPAMLTARAVIHPDGAAEVALAGVVQQFAAQDLARVAGNITEYIAERAAGDGRPVRVELQDPDGEWLLVVHPDGTVEEAGAPTVRVRRRHSDTDTGAIPAVEPAVDVADADVPVPGPDAPTTGPPDVPAAEPALSGPTTAPPAGPASGTPSATAPAVPSGGAPRTGRIPVVRPPTGAIPRRGADADTVLIPAISEELLRGDEEDEPEPVGLPVPAAPAPAPTRTPASERPTAPPAPATGPVAVAAVTGPAGPAPATADGAGSVPAPVWPEVGSAAATGPAAPGAGPVPGTEPSPAPGRAARGSAAGAPSPSSAPVGLPTLDDLLATRPSPPSGPAQQGWQSTVRRLTAGLVSPGPGRAELEHRAAIASVQRSLDGPKTVVVLNPKGGAHKTTAALLIAATFGIHRGGYTLAWDNNETRGTLGWRSTQGRHSNTAVNLLQDLDRFADPGSARVGDLDNYVRSQGSAQFDVLASDEDAASAASIDAEAFTSLHRTLARFYRVMVIDTGNNMRASNWQAAVAAADQLVIVSTVREDTAQSAAWAVDALRATGRDDAVRHAVTVLSAPSADVDEQLRGRLHDHFGRLTRAVLDVPHDASLVSGGPLVVEALAPATREAWLRVTAAVADGL
ncbi:chromosome partitioning protein [uncultured Cellulomonas sp.]|uniref:MinD/ParA family ATP-binding protein n=1 Tax=uncultured Cellulomonas sp. TaxID=189682 RepID=UPI00260F29D5|nr:chromosome partitioning protein [uncultured Cellulomonas sp.]